MEWNGLVWYVGVSLVGQFFLFSASLRFASLRFGSADSSRLDSFHSIPFNSHYRINQRMKKLKEGNKEKRRGEEKREEEVQQPIG